jgi:hypothetical protein
MRFLFLHLLKFVFHAQPNTLEIGANLGIEINLREVSGATEFAQTGGIVERAIETTECLHRPGNETLNLVGFRYICLHEKNLTTGSLNLLLGLSSALCSSRSDDHAGSGLCEQFRRGFADSGTAARHQDNFSVHCASHELSIGDLKNSRTSSIRSHGRAVDVGDAGGRKPSSTSNAAHLSLIPSPTRTSWPGRRFFWRARRELHHITAWK